MAEFPTSSESGHDTPSAAIERIVEQCRRRWSTGESFSEESILEAHPDLMPDLAEALRRSRTACAARRQAESPDADMQPSETLQHDSAPSDSAGLHIRCPHCHNPIEVLADTPFTDITCNVCGSHFSISNDTTETRDAVPLETIGHFELLSRIGVGGFGTVWKGPHDTELDRTVAVRSCAIGQLDSRQEHTFFREWRVAAQLKHPNIVTVHEVGREGHTIYIVSDLVRGITLALVYRPAPNFQGVSRPLCHNCSYTGARRSAGVVHRDLKPSNIILDSPWRTAHHGLWAGEAGCG